ncbi:endonuclease/exonuclease/phosphatase family protein [Brevibacterium sp. S111]|nr:endonuclease/exonuclease/phosphatase family protein [Brevibacterium sp. S111]
MFRVFRRRSSLLCAGSALALALGNSLGSVPAAAAEAQPPQKPTDEITVLQLNIWHQGTQISDGIATIADIVEETEADIVMLSEAGPAADSIRRELNRRGHDTSSRSSTDAGIISRFPITESSVAEGFARAVLDVGDQELAVYSGHLEYRYYANYLPRGYGGGTPPPLPTSEYGWDEIPTGPITDLDLITKINRESGRSEAVARTVAAAEDDRSQDRSVLIGGDFNEPSHLDWTERAKDEHDHNGVVMPWDSTLELEKGGYVDAYRDVHPDEITHPGVTWPAGNTDFPTSELSWTPKADERDRIDFVFHSGDDDLQATSAQLVGPRTSVVRDEFVEEESQDEFFTPEADWPTDHKGNLITYSLGGEDEEPTPGDDGDSTAEGADADTGSDGGSDRGDEVDADAAAEADSASASDANSSSSTGGGSEASDAGASSEASAKAVDTASSADNSSDDTSSGGTAGSDDSEASRPVGDLPRTGGGIVGLGVGAVLIGLGAVAVAIARRPGRI